MDEFDLKIDINKIKSVCRLVFVILHNLYLAPSYLMYTWIFLRPLRFIHSDFYWYIEGILFKWILCMVASWSYGANYQVIEVGEDISSCFNDRCLVLANHQSTSDVPLLMVAFQKKFDVTPSILWIMDKLFRFTNFGAVSYAHGDYFIAQGKNVRDSQLKSLENHLLSTYLERNRKWIILFPEGGFLCNRLETSQKYAEKNGYPPLKRVTLPRVGCIHSVIKTLTEENLKSKDVQLDATKLQPLKWIVDITIGYPKTGPLSLPIICSGSHPPCDIYMHYRRYPIEEVPTGTAEEIQDWMYARWAEKEELLEEFYETDRFPDIPKSQVTQQGQMRPMFLKHPNKVELSYWWFGFLHVFFFTSTVVQFWVLYRAWQILLSASLTLVL